MTAILTEIISRRGLIKELAVSNLKVRYGQPYLGFLWAFITPFMITVVYYILFSKILKVGTQEPPFFLYLMSAVFPWGFFQGSVMGSTTSLVDLKNLVKESGFSHFLVPCAVVFENMLNFLPPLIVLTVACLVIMKGLGIFAAFLPLILFLHMSLAFGLGMFFSVIYVRWRDIRYVLDIVLLFLFHLTPVFYPLGLVQNSFSEFFFKLYLLNPFVGILNLYRFAFFKGFCHRTLSEIDIFYVAVWPVIFTICILLAAFYLYNKNKDRINDYLAY